MMVIITLKIIAIITLISFIITHKHQAILKQAHFIREKYVDKVVLEKKDVVCESGTSGRKNSSLQFRRCDLIFLENALVIIAFRQIGNRRLYINLFFIKENTVLAHGQIKRFNLNSFNEAVYIEFGEATFKTTSVSLQLKNLTSDEKKLFKIKTPL